MRELLFYCRKFYIFLLYHAKKNISRIFFPVLFYKAKFMSQKPSRKRGTRDEVAGGLQSSVSSADSSFQIKRSLFICFFAYCKIKKHRWNSNKSV